MALTIPAGTGIAAWRMRYGSDAEDMICTSGVQAITGPLGQPHAQRLMTAWQQHILPRQDDSVALQGVTLRVRQDGGGDLVYDANVGSVAPGGVIGAGMPSNVSVLVEKLTARAGKRGRGRMFVPGPDEDEADEAGRLTTVAITEWNALLAAFLLNLSGPNDGTPPEEPVRLVLLHNTSSTTTRQKSGGTLTITRTEGAAGPAPDPITALVVDPVLATQRRRLR